MFYRYSDRHRARVFWWSTRSRLVDKLLLRPENVGDYLGPVLVDSILAPHGLSLLQKSPSAGRILSIGSVLHFASPGDIIWGSGINGNARERTWTPGSLDVRAVRGPLTRDALLASGIDVPEVYGDPALLTAAMFPDLKSKQRSGQYVVVPHFADQALIVPDRRGQVLRTSVGWRRFIRRLTVAELVVSSSLHGVILAEAYGIPARLLRVSEHEDRFKFDDYYRGTGRPDYSFATSIEEALDLGGERPPEVDLQALLSAFPLDAWQRDD